MKKIVMTWAAVLCCAMTMTVFTACTDNDDNPATPPEPEKELAECTIMWYGSGGGNVDSKILNNFRQFYRAKPETFDHVNIVAQYKVSATLLKGFDERILKLMEEDLKQYEGMTDEELENPEIVNSSDYFSLCHPQPGATYRFVVDPKKSLRKQLLETAPYGENNCDFTCADSLTNFINWAATHYPAKKYILVMADHGGGYFPADDLPEEAGTRGLIYDDGHIVNNSMKRFSAKSFARAVKNANVRPEGIVLYLCLMNNLEFLYEVKDVTDYIACSTYTMWAEGGAFEKLADNMASEPDTRLALANFVDANVDSWDDYFYKPEDPEKPSYYDLTLTETKRLNDLAPVLKEFTDRLVDTYQNGTPEQHAAINECTANAVKVHNKYPFYDMAKYMETLFMVLPEVFDNELFQRVSTFFNACIVKQRYAKYLTNHNYQVDYSVLLGVKGRFVKYNYTTLNKLEDATVYHPDGTTEKYNYVDNGSDSSSGSLASYQFIKSGTWPSTFADTYQQTTFDRLVGWSRWLLINESAPPAWSPSSFKFSLPEDDMSGIPVI